MSTTTTTEWHIEDRKRRARLDWVEYLAKARKTKPRLGSYDGLTTEQYAREVERADELVEAIKRQVK